MLAKKYPELEKPVYCARKMSWLDKWRDIQFHRNLAKVDERMLHEQIRDDARAEGRVEGKAEALEEARIENAENLLQEKRTIACNLLSEGSTPEFIQKITGLDMETIKGLALTR